MLNSANDSRLAGTSVRRRNIVSPLRPLAFLSVVVPVFVLLVYLFTAWRSITPARSEALASLGPKSKASVFNVSWEGALPEARTAYAFSFVEGRWDDEQRVTGIRVAIESLKHTGSRRNIVVLVGANVRKETREVFRSHGATVIDMASLPQANNTPDPINPTSTTRSAATGAPLVTAASTDSSPLGVCRQDFAPLHAFALYDRYDRVVWLDADHVVQLNMDELFLCGEFCMVYMNLNWYTSAVLVMKPSQAKHEALVAAAANPAYAPVRAAGAAREDDECMRAWEDFLLDQYWSLEAAPAFDPTKGQQKAPVMRLAAGYALNPLFWIEKYDWSLARVKEYAHMTSNSVFDVPAHSLSWPRWKPWQWMAALYFNVHWVWAYWKTVLVPEPSTGYYLTYIGILSLLIALPLWPIPQLLAWLYKKAAAAADAPVTSDPAALRPGPLPAKGAAGVWAAASIAVAHAAGKVGWNILGYPAGYALVYCAGRIAYLMMPVMILYYDAWPVYIALIVAVHNLLFSTAATALALPLIGPAALAAPTEPPAAVDAALAPTSTSPRAVLALGSLMVPPGGLPAGSMAYALKKMLAPTRLLLPTVFMQLSFIFLHGDYFIHFVLKIVVLYAILWFWIHWLASEYTALLRLMSLSLVAARRQVKKPTWRA